MNLNFLFAAALAAVVLWKLAEWAIERRREEAEGHAPPPSPSTPSKGVGVVKEVVGKYSDITNAVFIILLWGLVIFLSWLVRPEVVEWWLGRGLGFFIGTQIAIVILLYPVPKDEKGERKPGVGIIKFLVGILLVTAAVWEIYEWKQARDLQPKAAPAKKSANRPAVKDIRLVVMPGECTRFVRIPVGNEFWWNLSGNVFTQIRDTGGRVHTFPDGPKRRVNLQEVELAQIRFCSDSYSYEVVRARISYKKYRGV